MTIQRNSTDHDWSNSSGCIENEDQAFQYTLTEMAMSTAVQIIGLFLILSTASMFLKNPVLQKVENIFHMNILVCSLFLLIIDWYVLEFGSTGCEVYTLSFLLFGSVGTFSTLCIALERYRRMIHMITTTTSSFFIWTGMTWMISILLVIYPSLAIVAKTSTEHKKPLTHNIICFLIDSYLYASLHYTFTFLSLVLVIPFSLELLCYTKIYLRVRKAHRNRWRHDAAAHCHEHTTVIQPTRRKANIIQISKTQPRFKARQGCTLSSREQSIVFKGTFSVLHVLLCWLPFASIWLGISFNGFKQESTKQLQYIIILAKSSTVLGIFHYVSFNNKFRRYYLKSTFGRLLQLWNCSTVAVLSEEAPSNTESQIHSSHATSSKKIFSSQNSHRYPLEPICEFQSQELAKKREKCQRHMSELSMDQQLRPYPGRSHQPCITEHRPMSIIQIHSCPIDSLCNRSLQSNL